MIKSNKLGFEYVSLKTKPKIDQRTNILLESFSQGLITFNPALQALDYSSQEKWIKKIVNKIAEFCPYEDKGKKLYQSLCFGLPDEELESIKLINWENFQANLFEMAIELPYGDDQIEPKSFRPDITLFINGLPLCFIEVKKAKQL